MKTIIHVNRHTLTYNRKTGSKNPAITCKTYKSNLVGHEVIILDANGDEVARVVQRPEAPLSCGAVVWIETQLEVRVIQR